MNFLVNHSLFYSFNIGFALNTSWLIFYGELSFYYGKQQKQANQNLFILSEQLYFEGYFLQQQHPHKYRFKQVINLEPQLYYALFYNCMLKYLAKSLGIYFLLRFLRIISFLWLMIDVTSTIVSFAARIAINLFLKLGCYNCWTPI